MDFGLRDLGCGSNWDRAEGTGPAFEGFDRVGTADWSFSSCGRWWMLGEHDERVLSFVWTVEYLLCKVQQCSHIFKSKACSLQKATSASRPQGDEDGNSASS